MTALLAFFAGFFGYVVDILIWLVDGVKWALGSFLYVLLEGVYAVLLAVVTSLDFTTLIANVTGLWSALPAPFGYIIYNIGITQGCTIIGYALLIRLGLNLIPGIFTRV